MPWIFRGALPPLPKPSTLQEFCTSRVQFSSAAKQSEECALPTTPAPVKLSTLALCLRTRIWNCSSSRQKGREPARLHDAFLLASPERLEAPPFAPLPAGARQNKQEGLCRQLRPGGPTAHTALRTAALLPPATGQRVGHLRPSGSSMLRSLKMHRREFLGGRSWNGAGMWQRE